LLEASQFTPTIHLSLLPFFIIISLLHAAGPSTSRSRSRPLQKVTQAAPEAMIATPIFSTLVLRVPEAAGNPS
jgi:hypothetical protein